MDQKPKTKRDLRDILMPLGGCMFALYVMCIAFYYGGIEGSTEFGNVFFGLGMLSWSGALIYGAYHLEKPEDKKG